MKRANRCIATVAAVVSASVAAFSTPSEAHPHVWVSVETTVLYEGGRIIGLQHKWTFDDAYTVMAIDGLDTNKDGTYSREELAELAKVNVDGLKEFSYFTHAKLGGTVLKILDPSDYWLEHKDGVLALHFTLPLESPVLGEAEGFSFSVYDESFFIAFDFAKDNPVKLSAGAPAGCTASLGVPQNEIEDLQNLNQAFGGKLTAGNANAGQGLGYAQTVTLGCKKS